MSGTYKGLLVAVAMIVGVSAILYSSLASAGNPEAERFEAGWARLDRPVSEGSAGRSWTWGPEPISGVLGHQSGLLPEGIGEARYYDKARMHFAGDGSSGDLQDRPLNGRLVAELLSGSLELATQQYARHEPATINLVGDAGDPDGVTYSTLSGFRSADPYGEHAPLVSVLSADGQISSSAELAEHGVTAGRLVSATNHRVASVFWEFLSSTGTVWGEQGMAEEPIFADPLALTGGPLTEAYWVQAKVDGVRIPVLVQCFESRCMTFTPSNPPGWQVEFNNAGAHYLEWRRGYAETPEPEPTEAEEPGLPVATFDLGAGDGPTIKLEVAATPATRQCGLMHRTELPNDTGMLFVFEGDSASGFWNCNTFIPLTLAWIDESGTIIGLTDMQAQTPGEPQTPETSFPPGPYRYVIEANQGWFAEHGVEAGDTVDLSAALAAGDTRPDTLCRELGLDCG